MEDYEENSVSKLPLECFPIKTKMPKSRNIDYDDVRQMQYYDYIRQNQSQSIPLYQNPIVNYEPISLTKDDVIHKNIHVSFDNTQVNVYDPNSIIKPLPKRPKMKIALKTSRPANHNIVLPTPNIKEVKTPSSHMKIKPLKTRRLPQLRILLSPKDNNNQVTSKEETLIKGLNPSENNKNEDTNINNDNKESKREVVPLLKCSSLPLLKTVKLQKYISPGQMLLNRLYNEDNEVIQALKVMKSNHKIALQKDFDLDKYQETLMKVIENNVSSENVAILKDGFYNLNQSIAEKSLHKPRVTKWNILAKRIRKFAPAHLINKLNSLKS